MGQSAALADRNPGTGASGSFDAATLARAVSGTVVRSGQLPIHGGAVDSRKVTAGNAFFALPGERTDGHRFVGDAVQRGAAALVVTRDVDPAEVGGASVIRVSDALVALQHAAAEWRNRFDPLVVGVTGSLAKTSTKEQIAEVLAERFEVLRNSANENNEIGLPLTLLRLAPEHEVAVLEMGMYTPGDISLLAALARPSIGVVTAVRGTHLSRAGSIDAIEAGKRELVQSLPAGGTAVLNADDPRVARMASHLGENVRVITYGFDETADVVATDVESLGAEGMRFRLQTDDGELEVQIPALGRHSVHNGLAAVGVGLATGMNLDEIARGLARVWHAPHRTTLLDMGPIKVLDDSYNASPDSMIAALDLLANLPGRHVAILGEMLELGDTSAEEHHRIGAHAARAADLVLVTGPMAADYADGARGGQAVVRAVERDQIEHFLEPGDVVLIKGSRGAAMDELLPLLELTAKNMKEPVA